MPGKRIGKRKSKTKQKKSDFAVRLFSMILCVAFIAYAWRPILSVIVDRFELEISVDFF